MDYHKTFANYLAAKKQLFYQSDKAVVNIDDSHAQELLAGLDLPVMTFGIREQADITASEIDITTRGVQFDLHYRNITSRMNIPSPGLFSVFNAMGAAGVALSLGWSLDSIKSGLGKHGERQRPAGALAHRQARLYGAAGLRPYPDALENVLKTVRGFAAGRVVTLFGCGGDRDHAKRPIMGEVAAGIAIFSS